MVRYWIKHKETGLSSGGARSRQRAPTRAQKNLGARFVARANFEFKTNRAIAILTVFCQPEEELGNEKYAYAFSTCRLIIFALVDSCVTTTTLSSSFSLALILYPT